MAETEINAWEQAGVQSTKPYYRIGELADLLQVRPATVRRWQRAGRFPTWWEEPERTRGGQGNGPGHRRYKGDLVRRLLADWEQQEEAATE